MTIISSIVFIFLAVACVIAGYILLGVWVYRDATAHGANALMWVLLVLLVPSMIGLILYLIIGRQEQYSPCPNCHAMVSRAAAYCSCCGQSINPAAAQGKKPNNRPLIISMICCFAAFFVLIFAFVASMIVFAFRVGSGALDGLPNLTIGSIENSTSNGWEFRFQYSNGTRSKDFSARNEDRTFCVAAGLDAGEMDVEVYLNNNRVYTLKCSEDGPRNSVYWFDVPAGTKVSIRVNCDAARAGYANTSFEAASTADAESTFVFLPA